MLGAVSGGLVFPVEMSEIGASYEGPLCRFLASTTALLWREIMASRDLNAPNILFILSDDQGAWAMGCSGNEEIVTPSLDRLASTGIRF